MGFAIDRVAQRLQHRSDVAMSVMTESAPGLGASVADRKGLQLSISQVGARSPKGSFYPGPASFMAAVMAFRARFG
jgi:hypothetical protein